MIIRIAILAVCASTLALAQADVAQAQSQPHQVRAGFYGNNQTGQKKVTPKGGAQQPGIVLNLPWNAGDKKAATKRTQGSGPVMTSSPNTPVR